ncbi:MAG: O-antigen ligase family protein, partial [Omnitrophica bacterium]|nr:O-antigen ligase family protein [Candidatus Omnitrophota bacterium]
MIKRDDFIVFSFEALLIFLILLAPLFAGSLLSVPSSVIQLVPFFLLFALILRIATGTEHKIFYPLGIFYLFGFFLIAIFQLAPLSKNLLQAISPKTAYLYQNYLSPQIEKSIYSLTLYPFSTKQELIKIFSFFCIFFVVINVVNKRAQFERLFIIIFFWAAILAFYGIMKKYLISGQEGDTVVFSTFSYRNIYANYMQMVVPLCIGYALFCDNLYKKAFFSFLAAVMAVSVFLSLSRIGSVSLIISLLLMSGCFLVSRKSNRRKNAIIIMLIVVIIGGLFLLTGVEPLVARFSKTEAGILSRGQIYKDSLGILKDFPIFGIGLGNFKHIFPSYQSFYSPYFIDKVHSDYLQFCIEAGMLAAFFCLLFFGTIFKDIIFEIKQRRDPFVKNIVIGGMCGLIGVIIHNLFD